ncbi:G1/S-specific cyclin-D2-like [Tubulanus polymorphus]|uniref:G1/S-specific cyclin-D2-like n=1 Tax=Tubulanus polymorphus TaxID=672921 RepID=UPI003DA54CCB
MDRLHEYCREEDGVRRTKVDKVFLQDNRVLQNLISLEEKYTVTFPYFKCVQTDLKPYMRKMVSTWMLEVCEEQRTEEEVFPLAMNYMDRFLSTTNIHKTQLQVLGTTCLFIASKLKDTIPLTAEQLVKYTDNSVSFDELMDWELLVVTKLRWDLSSVTAHDFLDQLLCRLPIVDNDQLLSIKRHAQTFIALCATDSNFILSPPSMIAGASIAASISGLIGPQWVKILNILDHLQRVTGIESDCLASCQELIEQTLSSNVPHLNPPPQTKIEHHEHPLTPTDIQDVHF